MTERELMAAKYKGTAFECLFVERPAVPTLTEKEIANKARIKAKNDRHNALRKAMRADTYDNKQKANWTI